MIINLNTKRSKKNCRLNVIAGPDLKSEKKNGIPNPESQLSFPRVIIHKNIKRIQSDSR